MTRQRRTAGRLSRVKRPHVMTDSISSRLDQLTSADVGPKAPTARSARAKLPPAPARSEEVADLHVYVCRTLEASMVLSKPKRAQKNCSTVGEEELSQLGLETSRVVVSMNPKG